MAPMSAGTSVPTWRWGGARIRLRGGEMARGYAAWIHFKPGLSRGLPQKGQDGVDLGGWGRAAVGQAQVGGGDGRFGRTKLKDREVRGNAGYRREQNRAVARQQLLTDRTVVRVVLLFRLVFAVAVPVVISAGVRMTTVRVVTVCMASAARLRGIAMLQQGVQRQGNAREHHRECAQAHRSAETHSARRRHELLKLSKHLTHHSKSGTTGKITHRGLEVNTHAGDCDPYLV